MYNLEKKYDKSAISAGLAVVYLSIGCNNDKKQQQ